MKEKEKFFVPSLQIAIAALAVITGISYFYSKELFLVAGAVTAASFLACFLLHKKDMEQGRKFVRSMGKAISDFQSESTLSMPIPVLVTSNDEIIWFNDTCFNEVLKGQDLTGENIGILFPTKPEAGISEIVLNEKTYRVFPMEGDCGTGSLRTYYFYDITELNYKANEYVNSRPSVWAMTIDSIDEVLQDAKENERSQVLSQVEYQIEKFFDERQGMVIKNNRGVFMGILEERYMPEIVEKRFELLDNVRNLNSGDSIPITLSIGVSRNCANLQDAEVAARQALDMSMGRGGDQAAEKTTGGYNFYGGISKGIEKRTKVKTRIIATALGELIDNSFNVILMGHRFADLDALGSAVGLVRSIRQKGKNCCIAINRNKSLVLHDIERIEQNEEYAQTFVSPVEAMSRITDNTLLIVVDTHLKHVVESKELLEACKNVVVIDHHRRMIGYIDNAVIFYHEPYASSASEMVTELVQYLGVKNPVTRIEAEALLAGIMLDTRNFVLRTGVRTFEAAAYLRRMGADTVDVRKMFATSMESYQLKAKVVASASIHKKCAVAMTTEVAQDIKIIAPQAADELLSISGVDASFVVFKTEQGVSISGRSMGAMNVQVIMEALGGGGHQTMAACQFTGINAEEARERLLAAIDDYVEKNNINE